MKLDKHIAYRFLYDGNFAWEITETLHPYIADVNSNTMDHNDPKMIQAAQTFDLVSPLNQKAYYITETVTDKLQMLKVKKERTYPVRNPDAETKRIGEQVGEVAVGATEITTFNWDVFLQTPQVIRDGSKRKVTFILPDNSLIRMQTAGGYMVFFYLTVKRADWGKNHADVNWVMFWVDIKRGAICSHWAHRDVQEVEEKIYKILCFLYLSENEEQIVAAGGKHGTKKSGKLVNSLKIPVTVVTSKWNVTSVRTEGFDVSGHFRLQPTNAGPQMIFIQPFIKHGYVRRAKSQTD